MTVKRILVAGLWILLVAAAGAGVLAYFALKESPVVPQASATIQVDRLVEASGLASSHRSPGILWSHNDSGGQPVLYAFDANGHERGRLRVQGTKNIDWEAITSFELDGKAWIAIGDVGDNTGSRRSVIIHVIEEPGPETLSPNRETSVAISWSIPFRYETGPHDCEVLMVEPRLRLFFLITKRTAPPVVYTLPLQPVFTGKPAPLLARKIGILAHLPRPNSLQRLFPTPRGRYRGQPTDGCIAPDGLSAAVLTYGGVFIYRRHPGQRWEAAFQHEPEHLGSHGLPQAEGLTYSPDGKTIFVTGEQRNPPLLRYQVP